MEFQGVNAHQSRAYMGQPDWKSGGRSPETLKVSKKFTKDQTKIAIY